MVADDGVRQGVHSKASTLMWRSARCERAVNSTLAGETIAMSAALADAEWAQIMIQDILDQTVTVRDKTGGNLPFQVVFRSSCTLSKRLPQDHSIDAKSVFDALIKECAGNRQDRRTAVDLAIVRETLKAQGSHIRWIPHPLMLADSMTKAGPVRWERCSETLATHWKAGLGRRDNSTERTSWKDQRSQSSTVGNQR